jgi:hypothetical protein
MRPPSLGRFERAEEVAEQSFELPDLVRIEPRQQLAVALRQGGDGGVDHLEALVGELDDHAPSIVRVAKSAHETTPLESIDPARHACGREHQPSAQSCGREPKRGSSDPQGTQGADFATAKPELVEDSFLPLRQERPDAAQACGHLERIDLELGPRRDPAAEDAIG